MTAGTKLGIILLALVGLCAGACAPKVVDPVALGPAGGAGGGGLGGAGAGGPDGGSAPSGGTGGDVSGCVDDPDCDDGEPCTSDSCNQASGACVNEAMDGIAPPGDVQTRGDCQLLFCRDGETQLVEDNTDFPPATADCWDSQCNLGQPVEALFEAGRPCTEGGSVCDGEGNCVACNWPQDCIDMPENEACQARSCQQHTCGVAFAEPGSLATAQIYGDCQLAVCDGAGGVNSVIDDYDTPFDGNPCTDDVCAEGVPSNPVREVGAPCPGGACNEVGQCI
jgi:hypothetical protein